MIDKDFSELHIVGQRIKAVHRCAKKTNVGTKMAVDFIELANGVELMPCAYNNDQTGPVGDLHATDLPSNTTLPDGLAAGFASGVAVRIVDKLFAGRKGHGGGPCTKRVLDREELRTIIEAVYDLGMDAGRCMKPKPRPAPPEKLSDPIVWEGYEGFNPEFTGYEAHPYSTGQPERGWCLFTHNGCWQQRTKPLLPPVPGATPVRRSGAWRWLLPESTGEAQP